MRISDWSSDGCSSDLQPGTRSSPVAADGAPGDAERVGGLLRAQATEHAALDHLGCTRVGFLQSIERLVEREQLLAALVRDQQRLVQRQVRGAAATLLRRLALGIADQQVPHGA